MDDDAKDRSAINELTWVLHRYRLEEARRLLRVVARRLSWDPDALVNPTAEADAERATEK